ncbi:alpha-hydroxy-acid oxidizing protein [Acidovorax sp. LjRoot129]|uniref:alpha-hydroxy acid oxidase n=1 Tax=Acidovorax sp. LjRoot129 TaxID=3342260 RepID=UPI003ECE484D
MSTPSSSLPTAAALPSDSWKAFNGPRLRGPLSKLLCLDDFQQLARKRLPRSIYGYVAGAAETNASLRDNLNAFEEWGFVPRVLCKVARRTQHVSLFGREYASPFGIAPMGLMALSAFQGDLVLARAASRAGIPFVLSGTSLIPMEQVMRAAPGSWFQAYLPGDESRIDALLERVQRTGCDTLVVTVDLPVAGNRENNIRAGFSTPLRPGLRLAWDGLTHPRWVLGTLARTLWQGMPHFENSFAERGAPVISRNVDRDFSQRDHFDWSHIARIRQRWAGNLVVKGILGDRDATLAREHHVDGIIVSNHGGRQLDGAVSALRMLPEIVTAARGMPVMLDGGVRRGSDVLKALALGARMVFVGRPFNFAAAVAGEPGVAHAIDLLRAEVDRNLAMLGVTKPGALGPEHLMNLKGLAFRSAT